MSRPNRNDCDLESWIWSCSYSQSHKTTSLRRNMIVEVSDRSWLKMKMKKMKSEELKIYGRKMANYFSLWMMMPLTTKLKLKLKVKRVYEYRRAFAVETFEWMKEKCNGEASMVCRLRFTVCLCVSYYYCISIDMWNFISSSLRQRRTKMEEWEMRNPTMVRVSLN